MANIQVTPAVNALLDADNSTQSKAALGTLGVGTAGFVNTGNTVGCVPVLLANGKLPAIDGSNLTGLSEIPELHPTHLILNELGSAIAPNNTIAYRGDFLSRHNGTTTGGEVLSNSETAGWAVSQLKNKTIFRKNIASKSDGGVPFVALKIKVNGPNAANVTSEELGVLQIYACWVTSGQALPDTAFYDPTTLSINRYNLFSNATVVNGLIFTVTDNHCLQMRYEIEALLYDNTSFESTATKINIPITSDGLRNTILGGTETRTAYSTYDALLGLTTQIPLSAGATRDLVVQATIFSRDRLHVGTTFGKGLGLPYSGVLWYNPSSNLLLIFNNEIFDFVQYTISNVAVPFYYSATEAAATIPAYVAGKYIIFGDKDYYKKGIGGVYVTKYNYLEDVFDLMTFNTTLNFVNTNA